LFVSATRPGARFFGFVDWHRGSSIFLEPVSLGNYCVIAAILIVASWRSLRTIERLYFIGSTAFLLVACDGRLAATSVTIVLLALLFTRSVSSKWSFLYLPAILASATIYVSVFQQVEIYDTFAGRIAGTIRALGSLDLLSLIGLNARAAEYAPDNGIVYFILSQSLVGLAIVWLAICLLCPDRSIASRLYWHAIAIFIPLNLLVSYSFFSIKVASLIWFYYGHRLMIDASPPTAVSAEISLASHERSPA
jgi:putative polymerase